MSILKSIGKAIFGMPAPSVKKGDLFFASNIHLMEVGQKTNKYSTEVSKEFILNMIASKKFVQRVKVLKSAKEVNIGDFVFHENGSQSCFDGYTDKTFSKMINSAPSEWFKSIPL